MKGRINIWLLMLIGLVAWLMGLVAVVLEPNTFTATLFIMNSFMFAINVILNLFTLSR